MATYSTVQSSFPKVAEQIINYNKNVVDILTNLSKITETQDTTISFTVADENENVDVAPLIVNDVPAIVLLPC